MDVEVIYIGRLILLMVEICISCVSNGKDLYW